MKIAARKDIGFPEIEHASLRDRLAKEKPIYTTRVDNELGRYKPSDVVSTPWGQDLRVVSVRHLSPEPVRGRQHKPHPFHEFLTEEQKGQIEGRSMDIIKLKKIAEHGLYHYASPIPSLSVNASIAPMHKTAVTMKDVNLAAQRVEASKRRMDKSVGEAYGALIGGGLALGGLGAGLYHFYPKRGKGKSKDKEMATKESSVVMLHAMADELQKIAAWQEKQAGILNSLRRGLTIGTLGLGAAAPGLMGDAAEGLTQLQRAYSSVGKNVATPVKMVAGGGRPVMPKLPPVIKHAAILSPVMQAMKGIGGFFGKMLRPSTVGAAATGAQKTMMGGAPTAVSGIRPKLPTGNVASPTAFGKTMAPGTGTYPSIQVSPAAATTIRPVGNMRMSQVQGLRPTAPRGQVPTTWAGPDQLKAQAAALPKNPTLDAGQYTARQFSALPPDIQRSINTHPLVTQHGMHPHSALALLRHSVPRSTAGNPLAAQNSMRGILGGATTVPNALQGVTPSIAAQGTVAAAPNAIRKAASAERIYHRLLKVASADLLDESTRSSMASSFAQAYVAAA